MKEYDKALEAYEFALAIDGADPMSWLQKANVHFQLEQYHKAIEAYKDYSAATGTENIMAAYIAECYEKLEMYEEAISYYKQTLEVSKNDYDSLTGVAICLLELERYPESLIYSGQAIEAFPDHCSDAWVYQAEAHIGMDDTQKALMAYLHSISQEPEQPDTLMAIANICLECGEYETAVKYYLAATGFNPELEFVDLFLSVAFYKMGVFDKASSHLGRAMELNPIANELFLELCPEAKYPSI